MQQGSISTIASFTGTLLRREHKLGQKFVQLVFRENDQNVLCVSTDPKDAALLVGQAYHVEGVFKEQRGRAFVQNPRITKLKKHWSLVKRMVIGGLVLGVVTILGGTAFALHDHAVPVPAVQPSASVSKPMPQQAVTSTAAPVEQPAPTAPTTPVPAATYAPKKTSNKPAVQAQTPTSTSDNQSASVQQPQSAPVVTEASSSSDSGSTGDSSTTADSTGTNGGDGSSGLSNGPASQPSSDPNTTPAS